MAEHSTHIRHVFLYEFESGHSAAEAHRNLSQVFSTEAPSDRSVRVWFQRFKVGNKKLEDEPRSGRPTALSFDDLKNLVEQHPYEGVRYFASSLGCLLSTVRNVLRNGEKARSVAPTCIERRQLPKKLGHLHSVALQKPQIRLAGQHSHWR
ncbi:hypothetical protein RB195_018029 [Necator americanus]|uniref:Mos1 transposase HTH domain-containing protein n=1 Tax=Necator americanus TaxID=51031 RepID=A0ABR1CA43_NECAM